MKDKDNRLAPDYTEEEFERFLKYKELPVSKKLKWLDEMNDFYQNFTPRENKLAWLNLKDLGF